MINIKSKKQLFKFKKNKSFYVVHKLNTILLLFFLFGFLFLKPIFAQSIVDTPGNVQVTASIPDTVPPSTPILINPEDDSNVDTAYPVFQWYESTDNKGLSHYQFRLNGDIWFDDIPLSSTANDDYSLNYDPVSGVYTFVANQALTHDTYYWQIVAYDHADNYSGSAIWSFNVYIDDPFFRISKIGDVYTNINSIDPDTVPTTAISLFATDPLGNEPWIIASGDPNLEIDLQVTIPNSATQFFNQSSDGSGDWSLQLGILPRDEIVRLDFTITDVVGHESYILELEIIISQHYWPPTSMPTTTITETPVTPTPIPSISPSITPSPVVSPTITTTPEPSVSVTTPSPTTPLPSPGIKIPIIPPKEVVHDLAEKAKKSLPTKVATAISNFGDSAFWKLMNNFSALALALFLPIFTYLLVFFKFYKSLSLKIFQEVFVALWPWSKKRKHLVFEYRNSQAAPLVKVELIDAETNEVLDWQITSYLGQFLNFDWPVDRRVKLKINDRNFYFPIGGGKPFYLSWHNFYQGEVFSLQKDLKQEQNIVNKFDGRRALAIPTLLAQGKNDIPLIERIRVILAYLVTYPVWFYVFSFLPILLLALRYPSSFNHLALIYYFVIFLFKYHNRLGKNVWQFKILNSNGRKIEQNLILISNDLSGGLSQASVISINESLSPKIKTINDKFIFSLQAQNYALWDGQRVISEVEYVYKKESLDNFKLHLIENSNYSPRILQPLCQLLPRQ